ncbi:MAG: hypothetical protein QNK35_08100, partial [Bacteroides sp.]|nr:hypothetical protein [Bacteroides sp.]
YESDCYFLSCAISSDGKYLAASSRDETIKIWDLKKIIKNDQFVAIPDKAFLNALIEEGVDTNGDRLISHGEAALITYLDISGSWDEGEPGEVEYMKGIEAFVNLDTLRCDYMQLTSLDLSNNTALKYLRCNENQLSSLDVSVCIALTELKCRLNQLSSMDVSVCKALTRLDCDFNRLSTLDLSNNIDLKQAGLRFNPNLQKVCVWTMPFPPEGVNISTEGSPDVFYTSDCSK